MNAVMPLISNPKAIQINQEWARENARWFNKLHVFLRTLVVTGREIRPAPVLLSASGWLDVC